ncbi:PIN domain-containing protein [Magnetospirillum sp. SS-4]|uniref:PIN domain-containing protein n=1 Tax=Magnetospirillum sp. SS-4 TaxID=2681465 RepID=UPI001382F254|nr:PIN domain-containing protein [Magnetospirillum sp. SS-4]CAA7624242.1 Ribonuclease VapC [Magnetospirillum sp. SS-4]
MLALDTNVLAYAEGVNDARRQARALEIIAALPSGMVLVPVQVLGELHRVLTVKASRAPEAARDAILSWMDALICRDTSSSALLSALDLVADHRLSFWDALILAVAAEAGCRLLLTEDLHEGFTWHGVTVVNPFAETIHPLLAGMMSAAGHIH